MNRIMRTDSNIQFKTPEQIKAFQEAGMREELKNLQANSKYYKNLFKKNRIDISKIRRIEDLQQIPVTTKKELQMYGNDFLCVPKGDVIDYVTTSGTLGDPVTFALTENDLQRLAYNEFLSFSTVGITKKDIMQLMTTLDRRFMAGFAYYMGARQLGCGIIRVGNGIPELQWDTINRVHPTFCMVVPSFILKLIDYAEKNGIDVTKCSIKKAVCIGEALRNSNFTLNKLGQRIHDRWPNLEMHSTYASTEMQSSFTECKYQCGGHLQPELIIVEFLDEDNNPVPEGKPGDVTITTLGVTGMPLLRFKTGDICDRVTAKCKCGRNTMRLKPVVGRLGQMIKYKGTTLYPPALNDVLDNIPGVKNYIIEVYTNSIGTDSIRVRIGGMDTSDNFIKRVKDSFRSKVRVAPDISVEPEDLIAKEIFPPMSRKPIKFFDLRDKSKN